MDRVHVGVWPFTHFINLSLATAPTLPRLTAYVHGLPSSAPVVKVCSSKTQVFGWPDVPMTEVKMQP